MTRYDHAFTIAFSLQSATSDARDVTPAVIRAAILARLASLRDDELIEAVGAPFDTYEIEPNTTLKVRIP